MLGYSSMNAKSKQEAFFGQGNGSIWMDQLECTDYDTNILTCSRNDMGIHDCVHGEDAGVVCNMFAAPNIRLVGGNDSLEGRLEILHNNEWGTVCDDSWDSKDASVVCFMLGYSRENAISTGTARFGQGEGPIWMDDISCQGTEKDIFDCNKTLVNHNCGHSEDAGVICSPAPINKVRLEGGNSSAQGRVEVFIKGEWGTVCDNSFDDKDAAVICSMLGLPSRNATAKGQAFFGQGNGSIWMDNLRCTDYDTDLFSCPQNALGSHNCLHNEDAGVLCHSYHLTAQINNIRLVGGNSSAEGRVEVFYNGEWGTVCDDNFDDKDAAVVCSMLGYSSMNAKSKQQAFFGQGTGRIWIDELKCTDYDTNIFNCSQNIVGSHNCGHYEDAGVECNMFAAPNIRLVGGTDSQEGRLEILYNNEWGTVCNDSWDSKDASVVCFMLGYSRKNAISTGTVRFGQGQGPIWMDDVSCQGTENDIFDCNKTLVNHNCDHSDDAGVICSKTSINKVRLVGGNSSAQGRVEVFIKGEWGTVCDDSFDDKDAAVVCSMLGLPSMNATAKGQAFFGEGNGRIWMDNLRCTDYNTDLFSCPQNALGSHDCFHREDAGVLCHSYYFMAQINDIRLVGGNSSAEGRVEVFYNGEWGTVCDDNFDEKDAAVVCSMLGYSRMNAKSKQQAFFGQGNGRIWMDQLECTDYDTNIFNCPQNILGTHNCRHHEDAGVVCNMFAAPNVRLVGGTDSLEGRLEIFHNNEWGTVCDDSWDSKDASVVCFMLGYSRENAISKGMARFGQGQGPIWMDDVSCQGTENDIFDCNKILVNHDCDHSEDAGIICSKTPINKVRLVGGNSSAQGRLEVFIKGEWGTVCDDSFDDKDAVVVCSMLGLPSMNATAKGQAFFGQGNGRIWMDNLRCTDNDTDLFTCPQNALGSHNCRHNEDAGVLCYSYFTDCGNADILIIMDESGSVGSDHFNTMKTFVGDVVRGLNSVFFRFSVITYSTSARKIFGFLDFNNINAIMTSIEHIQYAAGGSTKTDRALEYARVSIFNNNRADAADIVILFTDGKSDNSEKTKEEAALLRNEGVRIFSIGVGSGPKIEELQSIASSPSDEHIFQVSSFSALSHILNAVQTRTCQASVDGGFSEWTMWTQCSRTCGHGLKSRRRTCTNPVPTRNGRNCTGTYSENTECSIAGCPVDGNWGHWSSWLDCSVTCGTGNQIRRRFCSNPRPENGGRHCQGSSTDTLTCNLGSCPIHGGFSEWNMWSVCSVSCGGGFKTRERACNNPSPRHGGSNCSDYFTDSDICNTSPCPVNGGFGNWGSWSVCSKSCGGGARMRSRTCTNPSPHFGGKECSGESGQSENCNNISCPVDGGYSEWSLWAECTVTCGGGTSMRRRTCTNPSPQHGGKQCEGEANETVECNTNSCSICNNPAMEFECHNKVHCIDKDYVCDGLPDCADNSDEIPAVCNSGGQPDRTCPEGLYRCPDGSCKTGPEC
ncbi:deleted in malignant brain tumors 1 protein-like [Crassostrea angulata]|uniref:deleted in malignant brain tumors 1 protein-like n=1 Tax=Magallana angulata TaxID=2784310 RepID=UPI0022B18CE0|nr:deleted in malignant brain tumors 1 protein-like [Crassostrea angulata]